MITKYWIDYDAPAICKVEFDRQEGENLWAAGADYPHWAGVFYDSFQEAHVELVRVATVRWEKAKTAEAAAMEYSRAALALKDA